LPRLEVAQIAILCQKYQIYEIGPKPQALILGEIHSFWINPAIVRQQHKHYFVDVSQVNPLGRVGLDQYVGMTIPHDSTPRTDSK